MDPHTKTAAVKVLTRFRKAVDDGSFDPVGERPALRDPETLASFILEWQTHYAEVQGLSQNSLAAMLNVLSTGRLGGHTLEQLAGDSAGDRALAERDRKGAPVERQDLERVPRAAVSRAAAGDRVEGQRQAASGGNPVADIALRVADQPDHFKQRHSSRMSRTGCSRSSIVEQAAPPIDAQPADATAAEAIRPRSRRGSAAWTWPGAIHGVSRRSSRRSSRARSGTRPRRTVGTRGTEMRRRLVGAFDGGLRAGEMLRIQLSHVNWRPVYLRRLRDHRSRPTRSTCRRRSPRAGRPPVRPESGLCRDRPFPPTAGGAPVSAEEQPPVGAVHLRREDGRPQKGFARRGSNCSRWRGCESGGNLGLVWHTIRHEYISRLAELTKDPVLVQELARHNRLETTQLYSTPGATGGLPRRPAWSGGDDGRAVVIL